MHGSFAGSGLVAYGLKGMFAPVWANDISEQKAAVCEAKETIERVFADAKAKHAIHIIEAWPLSLDGSGSNLLPWT